MKKVAVFLLAVYFSNFSGLVYAGTMLPVGTALQLEFAETVSSETAHVGQKVNLKVTHDVVVDKKVLIKGGTLAVAEVSSVERKGNMGKPGSIGIQVKSVRAVDGTVVPLSASRVVKGESKQTCSLVVTLVLCIFGLLMKGAEATLQAGSVIEATTLTNVEVEVE